MQATMRARNWFWGGEEPEWIVIVTVVVALIVGVALTYGLAGQTVTFTAPDGISLSYPAGWERTQGEGAAMLLQAGPGYAARTRLSARVLRRLDPAAPVTLDDLVAQNEFEVAQELNAYRTLSSRPWTAGGEQGVLVHYAYVDDTEGSAYQSALPTVIEGESFIATHNGQAYVVSLESDAATFAAHDRGDLRSILRSIRFR